MKKLLAYLVFVMTVLLTACGSQPTAVPAYAPTDPSTPIEVMAGSDFQIIVESNPSTGYHWQVMNDWDPNVFVTNGSEYQSTSPSGVVGGGGVDVWSLKAVNSGQDVFTLGYFPPGANTSATQTVTFTIKVK
ncbi:MAG: protease inhibitor I42 family protein [Anaerolineales bacterium]